MSQADDQPASRRSAEYPTESEPAPKSRQRRRGAAPPNAHFRSLADELDRPLPQVALRSVAFGPFLFRKMIGQADARARPGDLVQVVDPQGQPFGFGLYNPRSEIVVRMLAHGTAPPEGQLWDERLAQAVALRRDLLRVDEVTNAYRLVYAEADGLTGLVVDRFGPVLSAEAFSVGMYQRGPELLEKLAGLVGAEHTLLRVDELVEQQEGFMARPHRSPGMPRHVVVQEYGTRFRIHFDSGHKTGFFCDQRENRRRLADFCSGRTVLDLCCYTGGFSVQAKRLGGASEVTAVDLDEEALAVARENANLNQVRVHFVHADAFAYMRDMLRGGRRYDVVVLDPPKLIRSRREIDEGQRKYFDLNRLALQLVRPGGLLLTCSCSGLLAEPDFLRTIAAAGRHAGPREATEEGTPVVPAGRRLQILARTGAAPDHPVATTVRETEYLKAVWLRVL